MSAHRRRALCSRRSCSLHTQWRAPSRVCTDVGGVCAISKLSIRCVQLQSACSPDIFAPYEHVELNCKPLMRAYATSCNTLDASMTVVSLGVHENVTAHKYIMEALNNGAKNHNVYRRQRRLHGKRTLVFSSKLGRQLGDERLQPSPIKLASAPSGGPCREQQRVRTARNKAALHS